MGLEGVAVGTAEGVGEFRGGVIDVVAEGLDGKVEASVEKNQQSVNGSYGFVEMEGMPLQLASSVTIETWEHTGPARPDLLWQRACRSSIRSGQGPAGSQTPQGLPVDAHGLSGRGFRIC